MAEDAKHEFGRARERVRRRRFSLTPLKLSIAVVVLFLAACSSDPTPTTAPSATSAPVPTATTAPEPTPKSKIGGTVILSQLFPEGVNPVLRPQHPTNMTLNPLYFNSLIRLGDNMVPTPDLAKSWDISEDGLTYTFNLRDDVKWHDGQSFTAEDVKFSWDTFFHPANWGAAPWGITMNVVKGNTEYKAGDATDVSGVTVIDDHTIRVELTEIHAPFLVIMASQLIIPKHVWEDVQPWDMATHPANFGEGTIGTGPFIVDSYTLNETIVSHANLDYYEGRPNLDQFIVRQHEFGPAAEAARYTQLKVGQISLMAQPLGGLIYDFLDEAESDPDIIVRTLVGNNNARVEFHPKDPLFQDVRIRRAISYATDPQTLADALWAGRVTIVNSLISPIFPWALDMNGATFYNDLDKAAELFAAAGWTPGSDGILQNAAGDKFSFELMTFEFGWPVIVQQQWKAAGIDMKIDQVGDSTFFQDDYYLGGNFQMAGWSQAAGLDTDPALTLGTFRANNKWTTDRADELMQLATRATDIAERGRFYKEFQEEFAQEVPAIMIGIPADLWAITNGLVIPEKSNSFLTMLTARDWYWDN